MTENNSFFAHISNIRNPEIEEGINSKDPYVICDLLERTRGGINNIYLRDLENAIVATEDIVQIYEFLFMAVDMGIRGFDRTKFERIIRESKSPKLMCYCMGFVPGIDIEKMLRALEDTKNAKYMELLISDEEYSDVLATVKQINPSYEDTVEEAKGFDYYPESLGQFRNLKGDIETLKREVIATRNPYFITELANYIQYLNEYKGASYTVEELTKVQEELQDPMQSYEYLASVNLEDRSGLISSVVNSKRVKFMYYTYEYVQGLTEEEKAGLRENIIKLPKNPQNEKYRKAIQGFTGDEHKPKEFCD